MRFSYTLVITAIIALWGMQAQAQKSCPTSKTRRTCGSSGVRKAPTGPQFVTIQISTQEEDGQNKMVTKKIQVDHIPVQQRKQYIDRIVDELTLEEMDTNEGFTFKNTSKNNAKQPSRPSSIYSRR
jgi:hypothetical protein